MSSAEKVKEEILRLGVLRWQVVERAGKWCIIDPFNFDIKTAAANDQCALICEFQQPEMALFVLESVKALYTCAEIITKQNTTIANFDRVVANYAAQAEEQLKQKGSPDAPTYTQPKSADN